MRDMKGGLAATLGGCTTRGLDDDVAVLLVQTCIG